MSVLGSFGSFSRGGRKKNIILILDFTIQFFCPAYSESVQIRETFLLGRMTGREKSLHT